MEGQTQEYQYKSRYIFYLEKNAYKNRTTANILKEQKTFKIKTHLIFLNILITLIPKVKTISNLQQKHCMKIFKIKEKTRKKIF